MHSVAGPAADSPTFSRSGAYWSRQRYVSFHLRQLRDVIAIVEKVSIIEKVSIVQRAKIGTETRQLVKYQIISGTATWR